MSKAGFFACLSAALLVSAVPAAMAVDHDYGTGRMGARTTARTISVNPATGPDFEAPFVCGQAWVGSTRSTHSPSPYTIDFNRTPDRGQPALASAAGVVTKVVTLTGSYGRYVVIDHGAGWSTLYAHLDGFTTTVGAFVDQGDQIGIVGGSGGVTGPHLHFEERKDGAYFAPYFHRSTYRFGSTITSANCTDKPITGDWDGDGTTELGLLRATPSAMTWYQRTPAAGSQAWGYPGDLPAAGDFDGDKVTQVGVRSKQSSTWFLRAASGAMATVEGVGLSTDVPVTGDWDGNGRSNLGYFRPSTATFYLRADNGTLTSQQFGQAGDQPLTGDWNGDGKTDVGIWRQGWFALSMPGGPIQWVWYGEPGDLAVAGDWNGDGTTDVGIWRTSTGTFWQRTPGAPYTQVAYGWPRG